MTLESTEQAKAPAPVEEQETPVSPVESNEQSIDKLIDAAAGRMAHEKVEPEQPVEDKPEERPADPGQPKPEKSPVEGPAVDKIEAPAHWSEERRKEFEQLPPAAQRILSDRHREMERGYNDKFQELAKQRTDLAAWDTLTQRIKSDPQFAQHVFSYGQQAQQPAAPQRPEDPLEAIAWDAAQQAREEFLKEIAPRLEQQRQLEQKMQIQSVLAYHQRDPLYPKVDAAMREYIDSQPTDTMKANLYRMLDSNPQAYSETYKALRQRVEEQSRKPEPVQPDQTAPQRKVTPREAPKLEDAGGPVNEEGAKRSQRLSKLIKKIKGHEATPDEIGDYFNLSARF